jgi:Tol biopolymer transport system component
LGRNASVSDQQDQSFSVEGVPFNDSIERSNSWAANSMIPSPALHFPLLRAATGNIFQAFPLYTARLRCGLGYSTDIEQMPLNGHSNNGARIRPELVRLQLEKITQSEVFRKSARLTAFLSYVVDETIAGRADGLKEHVLAVELYQRPAGDFDSAADPIVRVDARRLRDKLREYYASAPSDPIVISLPKGSYAPLFEPATRSMQTRTAWIVAGSVAALALLALALGVRAKQEATLRPVGAPPGQKGGPSLSADGKRIAFSWSGPEDRPARGIYIQSVEGGDPHKLTSGGFDPVWSPDGSAIAFGRLGPNRGLYIVPADGGAERKVIDSGSAARWSRDGQALFYLDLDPATGRTSIFSVSLKSGERRRLTIAPAGIGDRTFGVSPNGEVLAFVRYGTPLLGDIYIVPASGGEPRRLTDWNSSLGGLAWTPDSREIIYAVVEPAGRRLWRISAGMSSPGRGVRLDVPTGDADLPSISGFFSGSSFRLAYLVEHISANLTLTDLKDPNPVPKPFQRSSRMDSQAQLSADGKRVVFISDRDGARQIWIAGLEGTGAQRVTRAPIEGIDFPSWSPDGQKIAFTGSPLGSKSSAGTKCLYVVGVDGGEPTRLTDASTIGPPSWSQDGRRIYFMSDRSGNNQIWKVDTAGQYLTQITRDGGFEVQESIDGKDLYYTDHAPDVGRLPTICKLLRIPVDGGNPAVVLPQMVTFHWSPGEGGIHYQANRAVMLYRFSDASSVQVFNLPENFGTTSATRVSRDGRWLVSARIQNNDGDLMLIDKLR